MAGTTMFLSAKFSHTSLPRESLLLASVKPQMNTATPAVALPIRSSEESTTLGTGMPISTITNPMIDAVTSGVLKKAW